MKETQLLLKGPLVLATIAGAKTVTRRLINRLDGFGRITDLRQTDTPGYDWAFRDKRMLWHDISHERLLDLCPHGQAGDRLWVRETWAPLTVGYAYAADPIWSSSPAGKWQPSIHMPRAASRILLEIVSVRVERLQDIDQDDARAEGITDGGCVNCGNSSHPKPCGCDSPQPDYRDAFCHLWGQINGWEGQDSWLYNPWVWVVEFRRVPA